MNATVKYIKIQWTCNRACHSSKIGLNKYVKTIQMPFLGGGKIYTYVSNFNGEKEKWSKKGVSKLKGEREISIGGKEKM